jgi:transportin-1
MWAFNHYQAKNLLILYDAIATLADAVGSNLNQPQYIAILLPPFIAKWNSLEDSDRGLLPLLEALTAIAIALGPGFQEYAAPVFARCVRLIESVRALLLLHLHPRCICAHSLTIPL